MYPSISLGGTLGTNFSSPNKNTIQTFNGYKASDGFINVGSNKYNLMVPDVTISQQKVSFGDRWSGWGTQINNNFRQSFGVSISVPINNSGTARFNYMRSKLNLKNAELTKALADQTLKNDIYKAYYSATAALEKFNAAKTSVAINQKAYDFAQKRNALGLLNTFDLILSQNNLTRSQLDMTAAQFDYVFKMKVLEFYKGQGIRL
jgi:outer membrane protein